MPLPPTGEAYAIRMRDRRLRISILGPIAATIISIISILLIGD